MIDHDFIRKKLEAFEGKGIAKGYVPCRNGQVIGVSGVTIATGLDLGQQNATSLAAMGIPAPICTKFAPYLGLKKEAAVQTLAAAPLVLTPQEVAQVDGCVHAFYTANTAARFDKKVPMRRFAQQTPEVQAVVVSLEYHLGPGGAAKFVEKIVVGNVGGAIAMLEAETGIFANRRRAEAMLLRKALERGNP
ncbi:pesticin C-terminus-like muramidase [Desulfovibrio cuneatus]|uniref:pesticin C-terminus-like muramidase n=1 Tax=Desulfovibrio cuneatus TaxID=159728 RepID=UPI00040B00B3|nr:pesticin C-terminus-like muramidase [Desulfovibrio cuneatus]